MVPDPQQPVAPTPAEPPMAPAVVQQPRIVPHLIAFGIMALISVFSIRLFMPLFWSIPLTLRLKPERLTLENRVYTPQGLLARFEEGASGLAASKLIITGHDYIRTLPMRGNTPPVTVLQVLNNPLDALPPDIGQQADLELLTVANGNLTALPENIGDLTKLRELYLYGNRIKKLPPSIVRLTNVEYLDLSYNDLTELPSGISNMENVNVLNLTGNKFRHFPKEIPFNVGYVFIGDNPIPFEELDAARLPNGDDIIF